jgi:hypothetical protein
MSSPQDSTYFKSQNNSNLKCKIYQYNIYNLDIKTINPLRESKIKNTLNTLNSSISKQKKTGHIRSKSVISNDNFIPPYAQTKLPPKSGVKHK